jgi:peptide/nickel transport system ATP-binding protein
MRALVDVQDLVISYDTPHGRVRALDGAELRVAPGETLAIVGESGSGKTTLGMAAGKLLPPEAICERGRLLVAGCSVFEAGVDALRTLRRAQLGFIFQNPMTALDPTMRIGRQVALATGGHPSAAEMTALLARAELQDPERVMRSFPHQLSGGMAQRVVIAMAIARSPKLLIADEPTASLDASIRDKVMATLGRLRDETGASLVILSHDLRMVGRHADRIAVMYAGRIVESGDKGRVLGQPAHPYTRRAAGTDPGRSPRSDRAQRGM